MQNLITAHFPKPVEKVTKHTKPVEKVTKHTKPVEKVTKHTKFGRKKIIVPNLDCCIAIESNKCLFSNYREQNTALQIRETIKI